MPMNRNALLLLPTVLFAACVPDVEDDLSRVSSPRVLALRATPAEAGPEDPTTVEALIAAPDGAALPPVTWQSCLARKPLTELGPVNPACLDLVPDGDDEHVPLGTGVQAYLTPTRNACELFGPQAPPPTATDPKGGRPLDPDVTGGFYQPFAAFLGGVPALGALRLDCGLPRAPSEAIREYNTLRRPEGTLIPNANPEISRLVLLDRGETELAPDAPSASASVRRGRSVSLRAEWAACPREVACGDGVCSEGEGRTACPDDCEAPLYCTGAESYAWYDAGDRRVKMRREGIVVSWYATDGEFTIRRTGVSETDADVQSTDVRWTAPGSTGGVKLWAVIRDDRGGAAWHSYRVRVE